MHGIANKWEVCLQKLNKCMSSDASTVHFPDPPPPTPAHFGLPPPQKKNSVLAQPNAISFLLAFTDSQLLTAVLRFEVGITVAVVHGPWHWGPLDQRTQTNLWPCSNKSIFFAIYLSTAMGALI